MANNSGKDTVYIDIDDEITSIIDKVRGSKERIVALVLPKRATVLQSIVNMKLLKKAADDDKKRLVLITSEAALLPLAGAAGLHVAKNLQSKPVLPAGGIDDEAPESLSEGDSVVFGAGGLDDFDTDSSADKPIGDLAGLAATGAAASSLPEDLETIELDDEPEAPAAATPVGKRAKKDKTKKDKKLAVPNFDRFRMLIVLGVVALIALIIFGFVAANVLPKATITLSTDTSSINTSATLNLDPQATAVDPSSNTVPAEMQQKQQSSSQQVPATGQQNNGQTAAGSATLSLNNCNVDTITIPAGTGLSTNGLTYITQSSVTLSSIKVGGKCNPSSFSNIYSQSVNVTAQKAGSSYNISDGTKLSVASDGSFSSSDVDAAANGAISGGTDNIVKIVAQADIDAAKQKLASQDSSSVKQALSQQLTSDGYQPIDATFSAGAPNISPSAAVGTASDTVTVTQVVTYTMYGVKQSDLKQIITTNVNKQIDPSKQTILDDGLSKATFKVVSTSPEQLTLQATSIAGPELNQEQLKQQVAGKKSGDIQAMLKQNPGITNVQVKFSPFWVTSAPKKTSKITIVTDKATTSSSNGQQP